MAACPPTRTLSALPRARCLVAAHRDAAGAGLPPRPRRGWWRMRGRCWTQAATASRCSGPPARARSSRSRTAPPRWRRCSPPGSRRGGSSCRSGRWRSPTSRALAAHATARGVDGVLLMPPCVYREGITEDATFRYFDTVIERVGRPDLRLYLYHFPGICGVPITPQVVRRLDERHPGIIAGVKDSGGDAEFTAELVRRFSHLSIFTGSETHLPELLGAGRARHGLRPRQRDAAAAAGDDRRADGLRPPRVAAGAARGPTPSCRAGRSSPSAKAVHRRRARRSRPGGG